MTIRFFQCARPWSPCWDGGYIYRWVKAKHDHGERFSCIRIYHARPVCDPVTDVVDNPCVSSLEASTTEEPPPVSPHF